jgi:Skp family chaperone for outer membrane proteins
MKTKWVTPLIVAAGFIIIALLFFSARESKKVSDNILDNFKTTDAELTKMNDSLKAIDSPQVKKSSSKQP